MENKTLNTLMAALAMSGSANKPDVFTIRKPGDTAIGETRQAAERKNGGGRQRIVLSSGSVVPKEMHEFSIGGEKVLAYSRKDAIKRLKHRRGKEKG